MTNDPVNHPAHYANGKYEVIDFIECWRLDYHSGNAVKYICRAGKKDPAKEIEDLQKAFWYVNRRKYKVDGEGQFRITSVIGESKNNLTIRYRPEDEEVINWFDFVQDKGLSYHRAKAIEALWRAQLDVACLELQAEIDRLLRNDKEETA